jgi:putative transposase
MGRPLRSGFDDANLGKGVRQLNGVFTQSMNRKHHRVGHLFQGRYKAILVDKGVHLLELCRELVKQFGMIYSINYF